jgi:hypothetical protein
MVLKSWLKGWMESGQHEHRDHAAELKGALYKIDQLEIANKSLDQLKKDLELSVEDQQRRLRETRKEAEALINHWKGESKKWSDSAHHYNRKLEAERRTATERASHLERKNETLGRKVKLCRQEIKEMQEREYAATGGQDTEPHDLISAQFADVFRRCENWARMYFKIPIRDFQIKDFPVLEEEVGLVSWGDVDWRGKERFKVNHIVQAVLGNILVKQVFGCPFQGCALDFQVIRGLYEAKLECTVKSTHS